MSPGRARALAAVAVVAVVALLIAAAWTWWPRGPRHPAPRALPEGALAVPRDPARAVKRAFDPAGDPLGWIFEPGVPGRVIAGHVLTSDGRPAVGAGVLAAPTVLREAEPWAVAHADAEGHFDLGELPAGHWPPAASPRNQVECAVRPNETIMCPDGVYRLRGLTPGAAVVRCHTVAWQHDEGQPTWSGEAELDVRPGENRLDAYMAPDVDEVDESDDSDDSEPPPGTDEPLPPE